MKLLMENWWVVPDIDAQYNQNHTYSLGKQLVKSFFIYVSVWIAESIQCLL